MILVIGACASIAWSFPKAWDMVTNADSLVLLDFARDILAGKTLVAWNLPRAPYFFPDTAIALLVMGLGWFDQASFLLIAGMNFGLLLFLSCQFVKRGRNLPAVAPWQIALLLTMALYVLGAFFPFSMSTLYWQLFASGAHFLTVIVVLGIFELVRPFNSEAIDADTPSKKVLALGVALTFAEALSDSMSALLIFAWYGATIVSNERRGLRRLTQYALLPLAVCAGTALSFLIPRQSLVDSFFSRDRFTEGITLFLGWLSASYLNGIFIGLLVAVSLTLPFLLRGSVPCSIKEMRGAFCSNYPLPALAVIGATPFFYQDIGSLRYLAFPGLLTLLFLVIAALRVFSKIEASQHKKVLIIGLPLIFLGVITFFIAHAHTMEKKFPQRADLMSITVGPAASGSADQAVQCIHEAAKRFPLKDGVAIYWNARPIFFASHFQHYLAQVSPWHPRSGYLYWGNNGLEMAYKDSDHKQPRHYNYILATNEELHLDLWGSLAAQSSAQVSCKEHTVLFYQDDAFLQQYLFPFGVPFDIDANGHPFKPNDVNHQWVAGPYWGNDLFTLVGVRDGMSIRATGKAGVLVYGPYIALPPASYRLILKGHLVGSEKVIGKVEVIAHQGKLVLATAPIVSSTMDSNEMMQLSFDLKSPINDAEFLVITNPGTTGVFSKFELIKLPSQLH